MQADRDKHEAAERAAQEQREAGEAAARQVADAEAAAQAKEANLKQALQRKEQVRAYLLLCCLLCQSLRRGAVSTLSRPSSSSCK